MRQKTPFELFKKAPDRMTSYHLPVFPSIQQMEKEDFYLAVKIHFGRPSQECTNYGICFVESWEKKSEEEGPDPILSENWAKAFFFIKDTSLYIFFIKKNMASTTIKKHFGNDYFMVQETFVFPPVFTRHSKHFPKSINPMKYPIHQNIDYFYIIVS